MFYRWNQSSIYSSTNYYLIHFQWKIQYYCKIFFTYGISKFPYSNSRFLTSLFLLSFLTKIRKFLTGWQPWYICSYLRERSSLVRSLLLQKLYFVRKKSYFEDIFMCVCVSPQRCKNGCNVMKYSSYFINLMDPWSWRSSCWNRHTYMERMSVCTLLCGNIIW